MREAAVAAGLLRAMHDMHDAGGFNFDEEVFVVAPHHRQRRARALPRGSIRLALLTQAATDTAGKRSANVRVGAQLARARDQA